jgi:peptidoglycan/LPS O-acetylase OafA/YrhL
MRTVTDDPGAAPADAVADEAGTAPGDRRFRPDVEGLRAVAVGLVVLYHASLPGLHGGYVGVDVFFVISGFVITGLLLRERTATARTSLSAFYGRRVRRILPAATLVIVTTVLATYVVLGVVYGDPTAVAARWTAVFLANFHFAAVGTDYLNASLPPSPLQNFWSLAVEEQFYLVYPAIFLVAAAIRSTVGLRARLVTVLVPIILMSLLLSAVQTGTSADAAFFSPLTRAWELALGALVAVATPALLRLPARLAAAMTWVGMAAIVWSAVEYSAVTAYPGTAVVVPVVGAALVVAGGAPVPAGGAEAVLRLRPMQWLGRLSYSLYLWHWPILIIAAEAAGRSSLPFARNLVWLVVSVAAAAVTYRLVENPVRHARRLARSRGLTLVLGAALVGLSLLVATVALATSSPGEGPGGPSTGTGTRPIPSYTPQQVRRMVATATGITSLPRDLTPTLAGVHADWGGPTAPCWPAFGESTVGTCLYGDPHSTHTVVLYGDSHAAMWFDVISLIAAIDHWRLLVLAKGDCPVLDLPFKNPPGIGPADGAFAACDRWHRYALTRMQAARPDLVLISEDAELGPGDSTHSPAQWHDAMVRAIGQLPVPASRVTIIGNIPQFAHSGPGCLSLHPNEVQQCSGPNPSYFADRNDAERRAVTGAGGRYLDMTPWFCSTTCTDVIGRYQPYWDPYHVTASYATVLSQVLGYGIDLPAYSSTVPSTTAPGAAPSTTATGG